MIKTYSNELYHHGIIGMKWGIRRYQNEDGTLTAEGKKRYWVDPGNKYSINKNGDTVYKKGFKFNRVSGAELKTNNTGSLYVSYGKEDAARYIRSLGPTLLGDLLKTSGTHVQHIDVTSPIKKASDENRNRIILNNLLNNPTALEEFNKSFYSLIVKTEEGRDPFANDLSKEQIKQALHNPSGIEANRISYAVVSGFANSKYYDDVWKGIYNDLRKNGYDAINDCDIDSGISTTAMMILNPEKVKMSSSTYITKDVQKEAKRYIKSLGKLKVSEFLQ